MKNKNIDEDSILTPKEKKRLERGLKEYREGKTLSLDYVKKILRIEKQKPIEVGTMKQFRKRYEK